jgi:copper chaperone CopZ
MSDLCCPPQPEPPHSAATWLSSLGAIFTAALATSCCWLPPVLLLTGIGGLGMLSALEVYKPYLAALTVAHLVVGLYLVHIRRPEHTPRAHKVIFWCAASLSLAMFLLPDDLFMPRQARATAHHHEASEQALTLRYEVDGMDCPSCVGAITRSLLKVPGVKAAEVSFEERCARVTFASGAQRDDQAVAQAIDAAGYIAKGAPSTVAPQTP